MFSITPRTRSASLLGVRQGNVSFRRERAAIRLEIHMKLSGIMSERRFRSALIDIGLPERSIGIAVGYVRTSAMRAVEVAFGLSPNVVRDAMKDVRLRLAEAAARPVMRRTTGKAHEMIEYVMKTRTIFARSRPRAGGSTNSTG